MINDYLSDMDGRQRGFSLFAVGGRGFIGATSVASMALNAASPAANAVWVQGATATNAAYANLEKEMNTQRLSGMAVRESMELTANDLVTALGALKFFEAYAAALSEDEVEFTKAYVANRKAFIDIETAVTLKPFTHIVTVKATNKSTKTSSEDPGDEG